MPAAVGSGAPLGRHLLANALGRSWAFLSNFLFVPAYVHLLGVDGFGVIALYLAVGAIIALLDLGLSPTLARELHDQRRGCAEKVDLLFTYEVAYAVIVGALILGVALLPREAFTLLLSSQDLAKPATHGAIKLVFFAAAVQLQFNFYVAGLFGVEQPGRANLVIIVAGIVRSALVIVPLHMYPSPSVYLVWQLVFAALFAFTARGFLYAAIRTETPAGRPAFRMRLVSDNLHFTAGMFVVSLTAAVNAQADKLLMGKLAGLGALAEYSLVSTFSQVLVFIVSPVTIAVLPRFVRHVTAGEADAAHALFLVAYKLAGTIVCAAVGSMVFFGPYLISVWTVGKVPADSVAPYAVELIVGYALLALQTVPHAVAVANKNLKGAMAISITMIVTLPAYWFLISRFGAAGGAVTWLVLQAIVGPAYTWWVNTRFVGLRGRGGAMFARALLLPLSLSLALNLVASRFVSDTNTTAVNLTIIVTVALVAIGSCARFALRRADINYLVGAESC